jgi:hypothetical protein
MSPIYPPWLMLQVDLSQSIDSIVASPATFGGTISNVQIFTRFSILDLLVSILRSFSTDFLSALRHICLELPFSS